MLWKIIKKIEEASKLKDDFTADGVTQEMLELYEKWDMDERTLRKEATEEARKVGLAEGKKEREIEIVKSMYNRNMDITTICEVTLLSKEEVEKILKIS